MNELEFIKDFIWSKKFWIMGIIGVIIISISVYFYFNNTSKEDIREDDLIVLEEEKEKEIKEDVCYVTVDIKGYIKNPGIYQIECNKRVQDVIYLAGGVNKDADTSVINLGKKVYDEMVIVIYSKQQINSFQEVKQVETKKQEICVSEEKIKNDACILNESNDKKEESITGPISINKALKEELMTLPGIGGSKADDIIEYRNSNGDFVTLEDIKNVKGIGDSVFDKIKDFIIL